MEKVLSAAAINTNALIHCSSFPPVYTDYKPAYCTYAAIDSYMLTIITSKIGHLHRVPQPSYVALVNHYNTIIATKW